MSAHTKEFLDAIERKVPKSPIVRKYIKRAVEAGYIVNREWKSGPEEQAIFLRLLMNRAIGPGLLLNGEQWQEPNGIPWKYLGFLIFSPDSYKANKRLSRQMANIYQDILDYSEDELMERFRDIYALFD